MYRINHNWNVCNCEDDCDGSEHLPLGDHVTTDEFAKAVKQVDHTASQCHDRCVLACSHVHKSLSHCIGKPKQENSVGEKIFKIQLKENGEISNAQQILFYLLGNYDFEVFCTDPKIMKYKPLKSNLSNTFFLSILLYFSKWYFDN